tara:strand:+ start:95 stop:661 length:567 start_codon:yes stop_codon:yes gene_type:complete
MRKIMRISVLVISAIVVIGLNACSTAKPIAKVENSIEIEVPFTERKFKTDDKFFRATGPGTSPDIGAAKRIAIFTAKANLLTFVNSVSSAVSDQYMNQSDFAEKKEYKSKFEDFIRTVSKRSISNLYLTHEKTFKSGNEYTTYVVLEVSKEDVVNGFKNAVSEEKLTSLKVDKEKFENIFNQEMKKYE